MNNEENKKCCCDSEEENTCGCNHEEHHCCSEEHECGCGCGNEPLFVDLEDEEGNMVKCQVVDGFSYKEEEYAVVKNPQDDSLYLFKVVGDDEEIADLVIPDDDEFEEVAKYYEGLLED